MHDSPVPTEIRIGVEYTTSWANKKTLKWKLIDVTNNIAHLKSQWTDKIIQTHVNTLRIPRV